MEAVRIDEEAGADLAKTTGTISTAPYGKR
jgi:hypothetical protein